MIEEVRFTVKKEKEKGNWGRYVITPLPAGFGSTVGNSLRRVLLGFLPGAAVTQMKIRGASHIFTTIKGVKEDLVQVMLNVKQIRFEYQGDKQVNVKVEKSGSGPVKAGDIKTQPGIKVVNPDFVLANLTDKSATLKMDLTVARGLGYESAKEHGSSKLGVIGIDSVFTPIVKVNYQVEPARMGKETNLDKLVIDIWTDGSIRPKKAMEKATEVLVEVFHQILKPKPIKKKKEKVENKNLDLLVEEIEEIPLRLVNALKKAGYKTVEDLSGAGAREVIKAKNVGEKSVDFLKTVLKKRKIKFK